MTQAEDLSQLEDQLMGFFPEAQQAKVREQLRIAEAEAELQFSSKREVENWQRKDEYCPQGTRPPQNLAALELARIRLDAMSKAALGALGYSLRPEGLLSLVDRIIEALSDLCVAKLRAYEDLSDPEEHPLRKHFRDRDRSWIREELQRTIPRLQTEAWKDYRNRLTGGVLAPSTAEDQTESAHSTEADRPADPARKDRRFQKTGDFWEVAFKGESAAVKHTNGMEYIARLLGSPRRLFGCVELAQAASQVHPSGAAVNVEDKAGLSVNFTRQTLQDRQALTQIHGEVNKINEELVDAEERHDARQIEQLRNKKGALLAHVKKSYGRGGRVRAFSDEEEKARKAVSAAIQRAIKTIRKSHPALAEHLKGLIKTGVRCSYEGDGADWIVAFG
jgi:hypothetical protein